MDSKFMSYFSADKASDKQSTYDFTHHNLMSTTFGGLSVTYWDKVLAKDYYKIAASTQSKGAALSSPTFTELKSNDYAFFVPNQVIWKHWNDYFTNGTEFADTYGSNKNNQEISGLFQEPCIPTNYLQLIGKIAKGYAVPYYRFDYSDLSSLFNSAFFVKPEVYIQTSYMETLVSGVNSTPVHAVDFFNMILLFNPYLLDIFSEVTILNDTYFYLQVDSNTHLIDWDTAPYDSSGSPINPRFGFLASPSSANNFSIQVLRQNYNYPAPTLDDKNLNFTSLTAFQSWYLISDSASSRPRFSDSPYVVTPRQISVEFLGNKVSMTDYYYKRRLGINDTRNLPSVDLYANDVRSYLQCVKDAKFQVIRSQSFFVKNMLTGIHGSDNVSLFGRRYQYFVKFDASNIFEHEGFQCYFHQRGDDYLTQSCQFNAGNNVNVSSNSPFDELFPQYYYENSINNKYYMSSWNRRVVGGTANAYDISMTGLDGSAINGLPLFTMFHYVYHGNAFNCFTDPLIYDPVANSLGYTQFGFFIYLYQNVMRHLDYSGLPIDSFVPRPFYPYAKEYVSALPYFAYSKIWNEYFRNRTVSSPEFDYSETNGNIFRSRNFDKWTLAYPSPSSEIEHYYNSWVIPFSCTPKSGVATNLSQFDLGIFQNFENELHYFNINNMSAVLSLLTGYQLNLHVLNQLAQPYIKDNGSNAVYILGFIYDHFVLPSYYNGLLHYKYQNFTKDYFSSALLDPMSGANQENIPQTVTELRTAQAKQSFWERTAVARSIKKFYEMMVGTTPTHIEYDKPLLLGADHQNVNISEVIQTSETDRNPLGSRAGIIADYGKGGLCSHFFNEPGILMVLHSITVDPQYMQGLMKKFTPYESYLDYPFTQFAHIGNESILMRELNYSPNSTRSVNLSDQTMYYILGLSDNYGSVGLPRSSTINNPQYVKRNSLVLSDLSISSNMVDATSDQLDGIFGYIPRFSSYKFAFDEVHGDFRESLDFWHTFREFHYMPYLSHEFVNYESALRDSNLSRIFAVLEEGDKFWQSIHFYITVKRSVPYYTVPRNSVN